MNYLSFEQDANDAKLRREVDAAARRERARVLQRFLTQSAEALLGKRREQPLEQLCAACG